MDPKYSRAEIAEFFRTYSTNARKEEQKRIKEHKEHKGKINLANPLHIAEYPILSKGLRMLYNMDRHKSQETLDKYNNSNGRMYPRSMLNDIDSYTPITVSKKDYKEIVKYLVEFPNKAYRDEEERIADEQKRGGKIDLLKYPETIKALKMIDVYGKENRAQAFAHYNRIDKQRNDWLEGNAFKLSNASRKNASRKNASRKNANNTSKYVGMSKTQKRRAQRKAAAARLSEGNGKPTKQNVKNAERVLASFNDEDY